MPTINWQQTEKQAIAWEVLNDAHTTEVLFGGGAGGGKTRLGVSWIIIQCLQYAGTRWVVGRKVLKRLKETTLATFFEVCRDWGIEAETHYKYSEMGGTITFKNGSLILLKDLAYYPTDPEFEALGSLEITGAFVDEASEVGQKAINILNSRRRYLLDVNNLIPKTLMTCNPTKKWLYNEFYKPHKENRLSPYRKFISALASENQFVSRHYIENLKKLDENSKQRLLYGNWEFDNDPSKLLDFNTIVDLFTNTAEKNETTYISCDVARFGMDKTIIMVWKGLQVIHIEAIDRTSTKQVVERLIDLSDRYQVRRSHIVIDEDGVGGGVVDNLEDCKGFVNNSSPVVNSEGTKPNYANLKTQCAFEFARLAQLGKVGISTDNPQFKELIIQEVEQLKQKNIDNEGKIALVSKDEIKESIGRSPDFLDAIIMRMVFEIVPEKHFFIGTF